LNKKLFWKLFTSYLLIIFVLTGVIILSVSIIINNFYINQVENDLKIRAYLTEAIIKKDRVELNQQNINNLFKHRDKKLSTRITVILPSGKVIGDSESNFALMENHKNRPEIKTAFSGKAGVSIRYSRTVKHNSLYVAVPLFSNGKISGVVRTSMPLSAVNSALNSIHSQLFLESLLIAFLSALLSIVVSRNFTKVSQSELFEKSLSTVIENSWNEIIIIDPDNFNLLYLNKRVLDECGYCLNELIGKNISQISRFSEENIKQYIDPVVSGEIITVTYESTRIRRNGSVYPVLVNLQLIEFFGKKAVLANCENISAKKEEEKIKNEFVSMVSHELRTPLTSIIGVLGLLLNTEIIKNTEKAKELLNIANSNSSRLLNLVNDILDMQKMEAGKMDFTLSEINLNKIINNILNLNKNYAEKYNVLLNFTESEKDIFINTDKDRFVQILTNLISNAIKFSPADETVNVALEKINDNTVRISVEDKGSGISEESKSKIFKKFSQTDSSDTRLKDGTGLGLYITKYLVEQMHGKIDFESKSGTGTTFYIDFPLLNIQTENEKLYFGDNI